MSRAIDLCTCGKTREAHEAYGVEQHTFFPNPQPVTNPEPVDVGKRVLDFLSTLGEVRHTSRNEHNDQIVLTLPTGSVWTIGTPVFRKS